jgi:hypothetical protein
MAYRHYIEKQTLELYFQDVESASMVLESVSQLHRHRTIPELSLLFDRFSAEDQWICLDTLHIDLGYVPLESLTEAWPVRLTQAMEDAIRKLGANQMTMDTQKSMESAFLFYLEHGIFPWHATFPESNFWRELPENAILASMIRSTEFVHLLRNLLAKNSFAQLRWVRQFSATFQQKAIPLFIADSTPALRVFVEKAYYAIKNTLIPGAVECETINLILLRLILTNTITELLTQFRSGMADIPPSQCQEALRPLIFQLSALSDHDVLACIKVWASIAALLENKQREYPNSLVLGDILNKATSELTLPGKKSILEDAGIEIGRSADSDAKVNDTLQNEGNEIVDDKSPPEISEQPGLENFYVTSVDDLTLFLPTENRLISDVEWPITNGLDRLIGQEPAEVWPGHLQDSSNTPQKRIPEEESMPYALVHHRSEYYVENAGLILLSSFLPILFNAVNLIDGDNFLHDEARSTGIYITQLLVTGKWGANEPDLVLNKLLCGCAPQWPVHKANEMPKNMLSETEKLLGSVIGHWSALKNTTPDGLRETFLMRSGKLLWNEDNWKLQVEYQTVDILLTALPWTFSLIRLPWMTDYLQTEW